MQREATADQDGRHPARGVRGAEPPADLERESVAPKGPPGGRSKRRAAARTGRASAKGRIRYTADEKRAILEELDRSGQTLSDFCRARGVSLDSIRRWRGGKKPAKRKAKCRTFSPDERRAAIEAFLASGRTQEEFAKLWGVSATTLCTWMRRYRQEGPQGLETRRARPRKRKSTLPSGVLAEIARTKRRFPDFGMRRVRDWLARFKGIRISANTVQKALREEGLAGPPPRPKPKRKRQPPRRFERSRPGELWQSDITSFLFTRDSRRVYLVVFLDDFSRYVVSWALCGHQKSVLVHDALSEGLARFGKPKEILTDQGRQYVSWRGKSSFHKLLLAEGIGHVVSRAHHPQTLGKCERLWKTIDEEFWQRARPQDLADARERLGHYFAHYNHFRPHQGIDGLCPADRFFGAQSAVREAMEAQLGANELELALEETPRRSLYLFGQVGDRQVSLHGERGRVVVHTEDGERCELSTDEMGMQSEERSDERDERGNDRGADGETTQAAAQARELQAPAAAGDPGAGPVGTRERTAAREGAHDVHGDPGVLAGPRLEAGDGAAAGGDGASRVAALAAGALGDAGGPLAPTADAREGGGCPWRSEKRLPDAAPADRTAGGEARTDGGSGAGAEGSAVVTPAVELEGGDGWQAQEAGNVEEAAPWAAGIPNSCDDGSDERCGEER
jgi:transposase InsO family protein